MDPLSITSGVIAVVTASGNTLQVLRNIMEARHYREDLLKIHNSIEGIRALMFSMEMSLVDLQRDNVEPERLQDCTGIINILCGRSIDSLLQIDSLLLGYDNTGGAQRHILKAKWLLQKPRLMQLADQVITSTGILAMALITLQGLRMSSNVRSVSSEVREVQGKLAVFIHNHRDQSSGMILKGTTAGHREGSSVDMSQSIDIDERVTTASTELLEGTNSLGRPGTIITQHEKPCRCHYWVSNQYSIPKWASCVVGFMQIHGHRSVRAPPQPCHRTPSCSTFSRHIQASYHAPLWTSLRTFAVYIRMQQIAGMRPIFTVALPRIIPFTAIIWSIIELGNKTELQRLLSSGQTSSYDIGPDGVSLLKYALIKSQSEIAQLLIQQGADPLMRDNNGIMAIQPAIDRCLTSNSPEATRLQLSDEFLTEDYLEQQCFSTVHKVVLRILQDNVSLSMRYNASEIDSVDANGRTALSWAAWRGDYPTVQTLIQYHAEINTVDRDGFTALARAAQAGHLDIVKLLLAHGASMTLSTKWGYQPIHLASKHRLNGHLIVQELIEAGADPNAWSHGSGTPLHDAVNGGSLETVELLLRHGCKIDAIGENGDTAAMVALYCWNEKAFLLLTKYGAKLDVINQSKQNILQLATWTATIATWDLLADLSNNNKIGFIDVNSLHEGHDIHVCFKRCRDLWFIGTREGNAEETSFRRMVQSMAPQELDIGD